MRLYSYFRSSAAYRVRIALNLKRLDFEYVAVHLTKGEQRGELYRSLNPQALVPTLADELGTFAQSLAIIEYLDERYPDPPLLPPSAQERARVRAIALAIACDIHPLNNLRVLQYLKDTLGVSEEAKNAWYRCRHSKRKSRPVRGQGSSVMATRRPLPTSVWCRSLPTHAGCRSRSSRIRHFCASSRIVKKWMRSPTPRRPGSRMQHRVFATLRPHRVECMRRVSTSPA